MALSLSSTTQQLQYIRCTQYVVYTSARAQNIEQNERDKKRVHEIYLFAALTHKFRITWSGKMHSTDRYRIYNNNNNNNSNNAFESQPKRVSSTNAKTMSSIHITQLLLNPRIELFFHLQKKTKLRKKNKRIALSLLSVCA